MRKTYLYISIAIAVLLSAWYFISEAREKAKIEEEASIVLQRITEVEKLMLVEGSFAEIYTYKQNEKIFFDLWPVEKKVIVIVEATANVGYDLKNVEFEVDKDAQTVIISKLPKEIVLLETDIQYYDIEQSQFYPLTGKDLSTINERAKELIKAQVMQSQLPQIAQERLPLVLENILFDQSTQNWEVLKQ